MTKLSIVIPVLNQVRYVHAALDSIATQERLLDGELEVVVVDGGSTDGTVDIIREYSDLLHSWTSSSDQGQTDALLKGFAQVSGDIMGWLCADDVLEPHACRQILDYFAAHPYAAFIYGDVWWIDRDGRRTWPKREIPFNWFLWTYGFNYIPQPATFWRRSLYTAVGGLNPEFQLAMDADLWARFAQVVKPIHVQEYWARVRVYPEQKTQRLRRIRETEDRRIRQRLGVDYRRGVWITTLRVVARGMRVAAKALYGCYFPPAWIASRIRRSNTPG